MNNRSFQLTLNPSVPAASAHLISLRHLSSLYLPPFSLSLSLSHSLSLCVYASLSLSLSLSLFVSTAD